MFREVFPENSERRVINRDDSNENRRGSKQLMGSSSIKDLQARSLAEALLLSNYQIYDHEQQKLLASIHPLVQETYKLQ